MSDFYRRRRVIIKDATALLTFFIGFVWSGAFVWPVLANEVDRGDMILGLAYFLGMVFGAAVITGAIGLEAGNLLGRVWESYHRRHRGFALAGSARMLAWAGADVASPTQERAVVRVTRPARGKDVSSVYYDEAGVYTASFIPLAQRVRPMQYEPPKVRAALARTTNIGAWDGARLVGVVRVLSDGYTFTAVADILVDPEYQHAGIGRALMQRALAVAPDARLLIDAQPDCVRFFERIGCDRGPTGFLMTATLKP